MPRFKAVSVALSLLAVSMIACSRAPAPAPDARIPPSTDSRRLTHEEIQFAIRQNVLTMYDLIATRRPQWLTAGENRYVPTDVVRQLTVVWSPVTVWLDESPLGGVEQLHSVPLSQVREARYLTQSEARSRLGPSNIGAAIVVTSVTRGS